MPEVVWRSRGAEKVWRDNEQISRAVQGQGDAYEKTTRRAAELGRIAAKVNKDNETSHERFTRQLNNAKEAFDKELISAKNLASETTRLTVEYLRTTDANEKLRASRLRNLSAMQQEIAAIPKLVGGTQQLMAGYTQTGVTLNNLAAASNNFFGSAALGRMSAFLGKIGGVGAALNAASKIANEERARLSSAGQTAIASSKARGALGQLAQGADLDALKGVGRQMFLEGGFETEDEALRLTYELQSADMIQDKTFWSRLAGAQAVEDPGQIAKSTGVVMKAFGRGETGDSQQLLSKIIKAAGPTAANISDLSMGVQKASAKAKALGLSDEETMGLVAEVSKRTGSGEEAGTQVNSLLTSFVEMGFGDDVKLRGNAVAMIDKITGQGLSQKNLVKKLGRQESFAALDAVKDTTALRTSIDDIRGAQSSGLASEMIRGNMADKVIATQRQVRSDNAFAQVASEDAGLRQKRIESLQKSHRAQDGAAGAVKDWMLSDTTIPIVNWTIPGAHNLTPDPGLRGEPQTMDELTQELKKQTNELQKQTKMMEHERGLAPLAGGRPE